MNQQRLSIIINTLLQSNKPVKSSELCKKINVTSRTLRSDIRESKSELLNHGIEITSISAIGYKLAVVDENKYAEYLREFLNDSQTRQMIVPMYPEDRINYLIRLFLMSNDFLKSDGIAERLFISKSTLNNDLKEVKERLEYFHLEIESVPNYGMKVTGSELHKRSAIAQYCFHTESTDEKILSASKKTEEQEKISSILYEIIEEEKFYLTDAGFEGLVIHIMIALLRLKNGNVSSSSVSEESLINSTEYRIAERICKALDKEYSCEMPQSERYFIAMHLSGKQAS